MHVALEKARLLYSRRWVPLRSPSLPIFYLPVILPVQLVEQKGQLEIEATGGNIRAHMRSQVASDRREESRLG